MIANSKHNKKDEDKQFFLSIIISLSAFIMCTLNWVHFIKQRLFILVNNLLKILIK
jgi:hypothetical protein